MNNDAFIVQIISIHAPAKGATRELRDADEWEVLFQSTLPRRERLERKLHNKQTDIISIHAPAKGATSRPTSISSTAAFQSTLPRRERPPTQATPTARHDTFQSTLPRRERPTIKRSAKLNQSFQSTLPRRERHVVRAVSVKYDSVFQSTLPRRERPIITGLVTLVVLFQSTLPRRERRLSGRHPPGHRGISIHAPAKGATYSRSFGRPPDNISIHAPAKGATRQIPGQIVQHSISIHAPAKGATRLRRSGQAPAGYFNPRSREGSDGSM